MFWGDRGGVDVVVFVVVVVVVVSLFSLFVWFLHPMSEIDDAYK